MNILRLFSSKHTPSKVNAEDCMDGEHTDWQPLFHVSKQQREAASKWMADHDQTKHMKPGQKHRYSGAIGGAYTWCFTATSLGVATTVKCSCEDTLDVSNYGEW